MWPVSEAFLAACRAPSQRVRSRAELWRDGAKAADVAVTAGQVQVDRSRETRRTVTATLLDDTGTLTPDDAADLLVPAGTQLRCWRGLHLPDGTWEDVPVGVFRLIDPQINATPAGAVEITVSGSDESVTVAGNRLTAPFYLPTGMPVGQAVAQLLTDRHASLPVRDDSNPSLTLRVPVILAAGADSNPWQQAQALATQHGLDINIDPEGVAVIRALPTGTEPPAVTHVRGAEAVITAMTRGYSSEQTYSGVAVRGEPPDRAPVTATVWDTDPNSPTRADGRFGRRPYFVTSQLIATQLQADLTALAHLPLVTGILETVTWEQVVNPALDVFDTVEVTDPELRLTQARLMIDSLTIPLDPGGVMTAVTRSRPLARQAGR